MRRIWSRLWAAGWLLWNAAWVMAEVENWRAKAADLDESLAILARRRHRHLRSVRGDRPA